MLKMKYTHTHTIHFLRDEQILYESWPAFTTQDVKTWAWTFFSEIKAESHHFTAGSDYCSSSTINLN